MPINTIASKTLRLLKQGSVIFFTVVAGALSGCGGGNEDNTLLVSEAKNASKTELISSPVSFKATNALSKNTIYAFEPPSDDFKASALLMGFLVVLDNPDQPIPLELSAVYLSASSMPTIGDNDRISQYLLKYQPKIWSE